jgi:hypothetical protein
MKTTLVWAAAVLTTCLHGQVTPLGWRPAAPISAARFDHCAVSLGDGRVLIAGGSGGEGALATVEIYGPDNAFRSVTPMTAARSGHSCTVLEDGRVLVHGGAAEPSTELYDPSSDQWTLIETGTQARRGHTATLLIGGRVLFAGGMVDGSASDLLEMYDPDANAVRQSAAHLSEARARHIAVALEDGRVLIAGGAGPAGVSATAEIYDPATDSASLTGRLALSRADHGAALLPDGRVLVLGGTDGTVELGNAEIYSAPDAAFTWVAAPMITPRRRAFVTTIRGSGLVLVAGGESGGRILSETEVYAPWTGAFHEVAPLTAARRIMAGALIADGTVLDTGGDTGDGPSRACGTFTVRAVTFSKPEYTVGETAVATGTGFPPNATVTLDLRRADGTAIFGGRDRVLTRSATTSSTGTFSANVIQVVAGDLTPVTTGPTLTGKNTFILRAQPPTGQITDGTSNTITFGESTEGTYVAKAASRLLLSAIPSPSVAGATVPMVVTFSPEQTVGPPLGKFTFRIGTVEKSRFGTGDILAGTPFTFLFCCQNTAGTHPVEVSFGGDNLYTKASVSLSGGHTVVGRQVTIGTTLQSLPLFTTVNVPIRVSVPAAIAPSPSGDVVVSRTGMTTVTRTLSPVAGTTSIASSASFPFRATFVERPTACFSVQYATDLFYIPTTGTVCIPTGPAVTTLAITAASKRYDFGQPFPFTVTLTFPPEVGILNRSVTVSPVPGRADLIAAVGQASVSLQPILPFNLDRIKVTYDGGGDLGPASGEIELAMNPIATVTTLQPLAASVTNPLTLRAEVRSTVPLPLGQPTSLTGTVQFFDGDLFVGSAVLALQPDGVHRATLSNVIRPVGTRSLRARYDGNRLFTTSTSGIVQTTVQ